MHASALHVRERPTAPFVGWRAQASEVGPAQAIDAFIGYHEEGVDAD